MVRVSMLALTLVALPASAFDWEKWVDKQVAKDMEEARQDSVKALSSKNPEERIEAVKSFFPEVQLYVVEPLGYNKMARALVSGVPEKNPPFSKSVLDGILGPVVGQRTLEILRRYDVKAKTISEDDALHAMAVSFRDLKLVIEAGGAASLAAVLKNRAEFEGKNVVVIASGGNVDQDVFALALRHLNT